MIIILELYIVIDSDLFTSAELNYGFGHDRNPSISPDYR